MNRNMGIAALAVCVILYGGCTSYTSITRDGEAWAVPSSNQSIMVRMFGGKEIEVPENHFIEVREPSSFVYGVGERSWRTGSSDVPFTGKFTPIAQHEERVLEAYSWGRSERIRSFVFVLPDSSTVRMKESDCVIVDSAEGKGLWCVGVYSSGLGYERFRGRIPFDRIETIEVRAFSPVRTLAFGLSISATVAFLLALSVAPHF